VLHFLRNVLHPARYHGRLQGQRPPFFEGWYFKVVDATECHCFAFIPGIFWSGRPHAFIQVLDGASGTAAYHEFPTEQFWAAGDRFEVCVGDSRFDHHEMTLRVDRPEGQLSGALRFGELAPWPVTVTAPGVMGWYAWVPLMECYHGVLSFDHPVYGSLTINGREIDFTGGRGYIEKDWGRSFPEAWLWFQSNHFSHPGSCLTASIAIIPWLRTAFPGFIIGLWHDQRLFRFATYTGAKIERLRVTEETVDWAVVDKQYRLEMFVSQGPDSRFGLLKGPDTAEMGKRVAETMSATVWTRLEERGSRRVLFEDNGRNAGLEVHEVESRLLKMIPG
jgi:hypothetical protein